MRSPSLWGVGSSSSVFLTPTWSSPTSTQAITPSEPSFWTYTLQIHCNGSTGPRSHPPLGPVWKPWPYNWRCLWVELLVRWWVQRFVKAGSSPLGEIMVASLLYHKERTAKWFIAQQAFDIMCMALTPTRGQTPANLVAGSIRPRLREVAAARSNSRGLRGETSSGR